jgi:hypothetical protein
MRMEDPRAKLGHNRCVRPLILGSVTLLALGCGGGGSGAGDQSSSAGSTTAAGESSSESGRATDLPGESESGSASSSGESTGPGLGSSDGSADTSTGTDTTGGEDLLQPVLFSVMGDMPYSAQDEVVLDAQIMAHNELSPSSFMVHLGDIKPGDVPCAEPIYESVAGQLLDLAVPTFVIPGDNEWNDCADPDMAWVWWETWFDKFEENWGNAPLVQRQLVRPENFAWTDEGVLFIGINLVGGTIHDAGEWALRFQQDADWVTSHFQDAPDEVYAAVVFGHAHPNNINAPFFDPFRAAALVFDRPVLFIHGNLHNWIYDQPWPEENMTRIQVDNGGDADPLQVTVSFDDPDTFALDQTPFD